MDLEVWDCFGRKKKTTLSYNQRNTVFQVAKPVGTATALPVSFLFSCKMGVYPLKIISLVYVMVSEIDILTKFC